MGAGLVADGQRRWFWLGIGVLIALVLGVFNYFVGPEVGFSIFYLVPVGLVAWYSGRQLGFAVSGIAAILWFLADVFGGAAYAHTWIYLWNTLVVLGFFLIVATLVSIWQRTSSANLALSRTDPITGAISAPYFYDLAKIELSRSNRYKRPLTMAYFDLDDFQAVNDRFGRSVGDEVLHSVGTVVRRQIRTVDIFARRGDDEFVLLMPETGEVEAQAVVSRIRQRLSNEMQAGGWPVTFSIGVVTFVKIPKGVEDMVKMAADVMLPVKSGGKNGVSYTIFEG
jgi:diguanylate cyclase (GGDEF)-like protein